MPSFDSRPRIETMTHLTIPGGRGPQRFVWHAPACHSLADVLTHEYFSALAPLAKQGDKIEVMLRDGGDLIFAELAVTFVTAKRRPPEVHTALLNEQRVTVPEVVDESPAVLRAAAAIAPAADAA